MKTWMTLGFVGIFVLTNQVVSGQGRGDNDHSQEVIHELLTQLPKGVIQTGKELPAFMQEAIKQLAKFSSGKLDVDTLYGQVVVITDMNRYLDFKQVKDRQQRELIKRFRTAFTLNEQWPIYINGESGLCSTAREIEGTSADNSSVYKLAAILGHEMVHARGQADEAVALAEEIKILERLFGQRLVELEWVVARKAKLAQIQKGQIPREPMKVKTAEP